MTVVEKLKWFNVKERIHYLTSVLMFKCVHNLVPNYIFDSFNLKQEINNYNTRAVIIINFIITGHPGLVVMTTFHCELLFYRLHVFCSFDLGSHLKLKFGPDHLKC